MESRNYYLILGVSPTASEEEIRKAYRKLAKIYHPDVRGDSFSKLRMREINEAYSVLGDPDERAAYDRERRFYSQDRSRYWGQTQTSGDIFRNRTERSQAWEAEVKRQEAYANYRSRTRYDERSRRQREVDWQEPAQTPVNEPTGYEAETDHRQEQSQEILMFFAAVFLFTLAAATDKMELFLLFMLSILILVYIVTSIRKF